MATFTPEFSTTLTSVLGGTPSYAGVGAQTLIDFGGTWAVGDTWSVTFLEQESGVTVTVGSGYTTGKEPSFVFAFRNRVFAIAGKTLYFSGIALPTVWNDVNGTGNGFLTPSDYLGSAENLIALAHYQGRLVLIGEKTTQIWSIDPDPALWQQVQVLEGLSTVAKDSVRSLGDLDVLMLTTGGVRSLRVRDSSLNAFVEDIGSPIDSLVIAKLGASSAAQIAAACAVIGPTTNRYWLFIKDTIYVLSLFRDSKVVAWSTYTPTYWDGAAQTAFVPKGFVVHNGTVYVDTADAIYVYGDTGGATYDNSPVVIELPWLAMKQIATRKATEGVDNIFSGTWVMKAGNDPVSGTLKEVYRSATSSVVKPAIPFTTQGTHFKLRMETVEAADGTGAAATVSSLALHFADGGAR